MTKADVVKSILEEKAAIARAASAKVVEKFGAGAAVWLGERSAVKWPCIPTGLYTVDQYVVQAGGIPRGRITEIYGPEGGGKTTLALATIAQAQKLGGLAGFVDAEHALDPTYAKNIGVDVDNVCVSQPNCGEEALETVDILVRSGAFDIVVVDSVAALVPQAELDGDFGDANMGLHARLMSQAMRKLTGVVSKTNTALIFINQIREKIGVMFGSPETTTGGRALKFYASLRLDIRRVSTDKEDKVAVSNQVKIKGAKNRLGSPFRECQVTLEYGKGFDAVGDYVDAAVKAELIAKAGAWYTYQDERFQGKDALVQSLKADNDKYAQLQWAVNEGNIHI